MTQAQAAVKSRIGPTLAGLAALAVVTSGLTVCSTTDAGAAAAVPPPRTRPVVGAQYHGLWTNWTDSDRIAVLDRLAAAGVQWVRIDVGWSTIEFDGKGSRSAWYLRTMDDVLDAAATRGIRVLATLWSTPPWAGRDVNTAPRASDYADIARWVSQRFRGRVAAWEVWNEPNLSHFYDPADPAAYAQLVRTAHPAFKAGDPGALVVVGGVANNDDRWLAAMYEAGVDASYDVLAPHPYPVPGDAGPDGRDEGSGSLAHIAAIRELMVGRGDGDKPIWFGEIGWSTHTNAASAPPWRRGVDEQTQARHVVATLDLVRARYPYVTHVFFYSSRDVIDPSPHLANFGLMKWDLRPKPALKALQAWTAANAVPAAPDPAGSPPAPTAPAATTAVAGAAALVPAATQFAAALRRAILALLALFAP